MYDRHNGVWVNPVTVSVTTSATPPLAPQIGSLWFDSLNNILYIWNGTAYTPIVLAGTASTGGNINLGGTFNVTGIPTQTYPLPSSQNAASISYVNQAVGTGNLYALLDSRYVNITGDTMTGILSLGNFRITLLATPVNGSDAATKDYADGIYNNSVAFTNAAIASHAATAPPMTGGNEGDISVSGGTASVRVGGVFRQFWPAQWA